MDRYTRWATLLDLLHHEERLTVEVAAARLGVSQATVRRDIDALAKQRKLIRLRGVALHSAAAVATNAFEGVSSTIAPPHARRVAGQVAGLLHPGTVVGIAGSALTMQVARAVGVRFDVSTSVPMTAETRAGQHGSTPVLTIVTNDLAVAGELVRRPGLKVVATGGVLAPQGTTLSGPLVGLLLQGVSLDTVVIAADAVDPDFGVTAADELDADGSALMIARARQVIVVARSADLDRSAFARVCGTERVDVLVTDSGIAPATAERFANRGVRVVTA